MIKSLLILAVCIFSLSARAQVNNNLDIQKRLDAFVELTNQKKYDEAFNYMYPKMFKEVSKQDLINVMSSANSDGLSLQVLNRKITSYSTPFQEGDETFVKVGFTADMEIDVVEGGMYDHPKPCTAMKQQFESIYGEKNVHWNEMEKKFTIKVDKQMMAVKQNQGDWFFVEVNKDQMDLMKSLFSEAVIKSVVMAD